MRTEKIALVVCSIAILGGVLIFKTPSSKSTPIKDVMEPLPIFTQKKTEKEVPPSLMTNIKTPEPREPASVELKSFERKNELFGFHRLSKKVFLNGEEKTQRQALLQNEPFIAQLKNLFKVPNEYQDLESQQNAAVDFLLAALNGKGSAAAAEVLKSIIQDPATENINLSLAARENLGGVKAEVLYKWSAQEPLKATEIPQWLPGPVSKKIWKNVLAQQEMNRAESALNK